MSESNVKKIHEATMRILSKTGMKFHHPDAIEILKKNGVHVEGNIAYFTEREIMDWVGKAPKTFEFHAQDPKYTVQIGGTKVVNATAGGCTKIMETDGTSRPAQIEDYINLLKLYEQNDNYSINGGLPCQPENLPEKWATLILYYLALTHSNKAVWCACGDYEEMETVVQLCLARFKLTIDELKEKPHLLAIVNTNTPLQLDRNMTETLLTFAKYRQPVAISAAAMAGTTAPVTLAGTLALVNAEVLSTIALTQMYAPGTPVLYGSQTTIADMATCAIAIGAPEGALSYKYCAEMARFYGLPSRAGGALTDAKTLNAQAGYESMMTYQACYQNGVNLVFQSAGIMDSYLAVSLEKTIIDFEIIDYVQRYERDIEVNEDTLPEEVIDEVGIGGQYLLEEHTLEYCKKESMIPKISVRGPRTDPSAAFDQNIQKQLCRMLESYQKPTIGEDVLNNMRKVMLDSGLDKSYVEMLDQY